MISAFALSLALDQPTLSPTTLAAIAVFEVNADRKWPADDREPVVTAEALRLLELAARGIATDAHIDAGKIRKSIDDFEKAHAALAPLPRDDQRLPAAA